VRHILRLPERFQKDSRARKYRIRVVKCVRLSLFRAYVFRSRAEQRDRLTGSPVTVRKEPFKKRNTGKSDSYEQAHASYSFPSILDKLEAGR